MWMVIFGRIQRRLDAAGVIPDNMWGSLPGRSTQEASFLYDMYLDHEDLDAFMASVDVKGAFPNMPHRLIEEVWRQLGLPYSRFGPPRPPVAILSPPCRLPVAVSALSAPCRSPVACLSLPCRCPAAPLSLPCRFPVAFLPRSCRYPVASCRFLSFPVAMLLFAWRLLVALLSLSCRSLLLLSCRYFLLPPCRPPVACLSSSCRLPVASLSPPCRLPVAQRGNVSLSCRLPVACLSLACRLPAASLSPPYRLPVASLSPNVVTCRSPVACLSLACRLPVAFPSPPCRLPVASLSPNVLPYRWKAIDTSNRQFDSTKNVVYSCQIVRSRLSKPPQRCAKQ